MQWKCTDSFWRVVVIVRQARLFCVSNHCDCHQHQTSLAILSLVLEGLALNASLIVDERRVNDCLGVIGGRDEVRKFAAFTAQN